MGSFRIGRAYAKHVYPERRGGGGDPLTAFARNFASGPKGSTSVSLAGTQVPWNSVDVGPNGVNVPITPVSTGIVRIAGVLTLANSTGAPVFVSVHIQVDSVSLPIPLSQTVSVPATGTVDVPFLTETDAGDTPVGVTSHIQVLLNAASDSAITLTQEGSTLDIQEVSEATG